MFEARPKVESVMELGDRRSGPTWKFTMFWWNQSPKIELGEASGKRREAGNWCHLISRNKWSLLSPQSGPPAAPPRGLPHPTPHLAPRSHHYVAVCVHSPLLLRCTLHQSSSNLHVTLLSHLRLAKKEGLLALKLGDALQSVPRRSTFQAAAASQVQRRPAACQEMPLMNFTLAPLTQQDP